MKATHLTRRGLLASLGGTVAATLTGCADFLRGPVYDRSPEADEASRAAAPIEPPVLASRPALPPLFDDIEKRTFEFFWGTANPSNGLLPDRYPSPSPASVAAIGLR